ncbi:hypothetical protein ACF0H5_000343 [Mactra antiquata]
MANLNDAANDDLERVARALARIGEEIARRVDNDGIAERDINDAHFYSSLGRHLRDIGDDLDTHERFELLRILNQTTGSSSVGQRTYIYFAVLLRSFTSLVANKTRISVESVKSVVRMFLQLWNNQKLSQNIADVIHEEAKQVFPREVNNMNDEFIELYHNCLSNGSQLVKDIRIMTVGMFGVGKTSLLDNLVSVEDGTTEQIKKNTNNPESTVGIDVTNCEVLEDGRWMKIYDTNFADEKLATALVDLKRENMKPGDGLQEVVRQLSNENQNCQQHEVSEVPTLEDFSSTLENSAVEELMHKVTEIMSNPKVSKDIRVSLWDFAGQYIYYSTHHFFLNHRSIYLLLMDVSKPLNDLAGDSSVFPVTGFTDEDFTCLEVFKFWLRSIYMYYSTRISKSSIKPCVILIGTHKDELTCKEDDKEQFKEDFFNEALGSFIKTPLLQLVHRKKFLINNLDRNEDYQSIRNEIITIAKQQDYWNEPRPAKWISLERSLENFKAEGKEVISFDDLKTADMMNDMPIGNEKELKSFLQLQHLLGNVLYFDTKILHKCIILSPQWMIDAFRCFISHMPDKDPKLLHLWKDYEQRGILTYELIDEIIDKNQNTVIFKSYKKEIIEYMELLDMIAQPVDVYNYDQLDENTTPDTNMPETSQASNLQMPQHFYFVPIMLQSQHLHKEKLPKWQNSPQAPSKSPVLALVFKDGFLPPSVFHRLLAICIRKWPVRETGGQLILFNGLAAFCMTKTSILTIWYQDNIVYGRVCCYEKSRDIKQLCVEARLFLSNSLRSILNILPNKGVFSEVIPFDECIQCSHISKFEAGKGLIKMRDFLYNDVILCDHCEEEHSLDRCDGLAPWCNDLLLQCDVQLSPDVLNRSPTPDEFVKIAMKCIGEEYFRLCLELDVNDKRLEQLREENKHHTPTRIYHMLIEAEKGGRKDGKELTVKMIRNALIAVGGDVTKFDDVFMETGSSSEEPTSFMAYLCESDLVKLTESIGDEYWLLGILLGITEVRMQQLRVKHVQMPVRINAMLMEWKQLKKSAGVLYKAMKIVNSDCTYIHDFCYSAMK